VSDHPLIVLSDDLEPFCDQVKPHPFHSSLPRLLTLPHPLELLLEGEESGLDVSVGLLLGSVPLHFGNQPPWPHALHFSQQLVIEVGGACKELIQPGLEGFDGHCVFVIFHFFVCVGVGKYFFDKRGVVAGPITGQARHHPPGKESDPVGLFPYVFLEGEHEVGGSFGIVPQVSLRAGMVGSLVFLELARELLESFVLYLVPMLELLQLLPMEGLTVLDGFDKPLGHLHDGFGIIGGEGEEVFC
jgi:hypothetical protein